jgi:hypothetical protein
MVGLVAVACALLLGLVLNFSEGPREGHRGNPNAPKPSTVTSSIR